MIANRSFDSIKLSKALDRLLKRKTTKTGKTREGV